MKKRSLFSKILGLAAMLVGCILAVVAVDYYLSFFLLPVEINLKLNY